MYLIRKIKEKKKLKFRMDLLRWNKLSRVPKQDSTWRCEQLVVMNQKKAGKNLLRGQESSLTPAATTFGSISCLSVLWLLCHMWLLKSRELRQKEPVLCGFSWSFFSCMVLLMQRRKAKRLSRVLQEQESWWNTPPAPNVFIAETCALLCFLGNRPLEAKPG